MKKYSGAALLNLGLIIAIAPLASAGTIGISGGTLIVGTEPGDGAQSISGAISGTDLVISGITFDLVTPGCASTAPGTFTCPLSGFNELVVLGGDGDDAITMAGITAPTFAIMILGGRGNDVLVGSGGPDTIFGGPGDDVLIGGPGVDCLNPGPGDNITIQSLIPNGCSGPDPVVTPLPRAAATDVPEPGGLLLFGTGLIALPLAGRKLRERRSAHRS